MLKFVGGGGAIVFTKRQLIVSFSTKSLKVKIKNKTNSLVKVFIIIIFINIFTEFRLLNVPWNSYVKVFGEKFSHFHLKRR